MDGGGAEVEKESAEEEMKEPKLEELQDPNFHGVERIKLFCGSWNLGGKPCPPAQSLQEWLFPGDFDLYTIGTQECEVPPQVSSKIFSQRIYKEYDFQALTPLRRLVQIRPKDSSGRQNCVVHWAASTP